MGRDQTDGHRLQFSDSALSDLQHGNRLANHLPSAMSKARGAGVAKNESVSAGTLVFIKHEGNKFSPRESYIVVEVKDETAIVQKMNNGKFSSRQYSVPVSRIFPCVGASEVNKKEEKVTEPTLSSSDEDDLVTFDMPNHHRSEEISSDSDSEDDSDESTSDPDLSESDGTRIVTSPRRSSRVRRTPPRFGDPVLYDSHSSLPGENDVTTPWWPGYPRQTD